MSYVPRFPDERRKMRVAFLSRRLQNTGVELDQ